MAALSTFKKLLNNSSSPSRILTSLPNPFVLHLPNPSQPHQQLNNITQNDGKNTVKVAPFLDSFKEMRFTPFDSLPFSSIHPFGLCSYPILATGSLQDLQNNNEDDSGMWADSVKKKRKKKMNKHKYRKLRKRLRRQT